MKSQLISNKVWIILVAFTGLCILFVLIVLWTNPPVKPNITVLNMRPCFQEGGKWIFVEDFLINDLKHICAEVETDTYPETLTVIIEPVDNLWNSYVYETPINLQKSEISLFISDKLSPNRYRARILYARDTLASIYFDVNEK